ncbi:MAG: aminotransferase class I/II-fold pyridoxal phosphate-dependent enzyme [Nitrososphaerales archaeon]
MDDLEPLRGEMREVTAEIMKQIKKRMEIAKRIGEVKSRKSLDVVDDKAEEDLRSFIMKICEQIGLEPDLAARLLNILMIESARVQEAGKGTHMAVFAKAKELESQGKKIIHLEVGEPDFAPPPSIKDALADAMDSGHYHYTETAGVPRLREALAGSLKRKFNASVAGDQIIVTPGGRFAVFLAFSTLLKPGDEILVIEPAWPAYRDCAGLVNAKVRTLRTTLEDGWVPDLNELERMITDNSRMLVINYPNNPTGKVLGANSLDKIVAIAKDHKLLLLSDEVYSDYSFRKFTSVLSSNYDDGIIVSSFSKGPAMTGFRVGYAAARKEIIQRMAKLQATALTSVAEPMQYAAISALQKNSIRENAEVMKKRLFLIANRLKKMPVSFAEPEGAMYVFARVDLDSFRADQFVESTLEKGLALAPGGGFGNYPEFVRISAGQPENLIEEGLDILERSLGSEGREEVAAEEEAQQREGR